MKSRAPLPQWLIMAIGSVFVLFSVFCFGAGVWRLSIPPPVPDAARIHPALLVFVNGILGMVSLAALIGIWVDARISVAQDCAANCGPLGADVRPNWNEDDRGGCVRR